MLEGRSHNAVSPFKSKDFGLYVDHKINKLRTPNSSISIQITWLQILAFGYYQKVIINFGFYTSLIGMIKHTQHDKTP